MDPDDAGAAADGCGREETVAAFPSDTAGVGVRRVVAAAVLAFIFSSRGVTAVNSENVIEEEIPTDEPIQPVLATA